MTAHERLAALLGWAAAGGIYLDPIEIRIDDLGNRSTFARRDIVADEALVVVPRHMLITDADMATTPVGAEVRSFESMLHDRHVSVAVWLVLERRDDASRWKPYLDALPATYEWMPTERCADELALLAGTRALRVVTAAVADLIDDLELLRDLVPELAALALAELGWGKRVAGSRCFGMRGEDGSARCLLPIVDMIDHGRTNARSTYVPASRSIEVRASQSIRAGEEIRHSYGEHGNARLLSSYGFALPQNSEDEAELIFGSPAGRSYAVGLRFDRRFDQALTAAARAADTDDLRTVLDTVARAADETRARIAIVHGVAGDQAWRATCAIVRDGERAILQHIADAARAAETVEALTTLLDRARCA